MSEPAARSLAFAAAHSAITAAGCLLEFARNGPGGYHAFDEGTIEQLADACKLAIEIEAEQTGPDEERDQLLAQLVRYLEGWV